MGMRFFDVRDVLTSVLGLFISTLACAQSQIFAYPSIGQSEEQQSRDRFECHQWSVSQTGFDPTTAPPLPAQAAIPPPNQTYQQGYNQGGYGDQRQPSNRGFLGLGDGGFFQGGGLVGDAATGAALGAAGGAIAGDAGQGAAIGALASTVFGAFSRSRQSSDPTPQQQHYQRLQQYQQTQQAQSDRAYLERIDRVDEYNRAYSACMRSREYTVN